MSRFTAPATHPKTLAQTCQFESGVSLTLDLQRASSILLAGEHWL
jgi:hypothetical protein